MKNIAATITATAVPAPEGRYWPIFVGTGKKARTHAFAATQGPAVCGATIRKGTHFQPAPGRGLAETVTALELRDIPCASCYMALQG